MTKDEALLLAIKALKSIDEAMPFPVAKLAIKECTAALEANEFNPDWDTQAVLTEEIQRMAKRIEELEAKDESEHSDELTIAYMSGLHRGKELAQRKPLTDEEIVETFCKAPHQTQHVAWFAAGVRFAEASHGIKENT